MFDLKGYGGLLLDGLWMTLAVGLSSMLLALLLGLLGSWAKLSRNPIAVWFADLYTTVVRGIPELILLLLVYFGIPTLIQDIAARFGHDITINLNPFMAGTLAIGFIYGAFSTEVFRGAFMSIAPGQLEAAKAMGMGRSLSFRRILLPQAMRFALPGLGNVWMVLIKATALVSIIQLDELMRKTKIAANATHEPFTFYFLASLLYLGLTIISMLVQSRAECWANRGVAER
ncbi:MAG: ABC transporter permease subunit [Sedimenticola sp.]|uniref:ABC transporter permease subunit n=1 Tax=Sedimenticola thiotaurini TaxID=1543721 RepID=A0A558D9U9_9GAMM|nr:ABC transporter permease subunit [Sedimenticola sp.]TVT57802.1 MAG: ABC transporter permease subunit [Sedimenticola thiotaurini]